MFNIHDICDYIILRLRAEEGSDLNHLKLQKLLYYSQAWYLAFGFGSLFNGKFQAWIHGPVNRDVYNRFRDTKYMYSDVGINDVINQNVVNELNSQAKMHIDTILDSYAKYTPSQLEAMTHEEDPWILARKGFGENQRCEVEIDEKLMEQYYKQRLS